MIILANPRSDWNVLRPLLFESIGQTLTMVLVTLVIGGFLGLILGVVLYGTRPGNLFENAVVYRILDIIVNIVRPIPFIIFLAALILAYAFLFIGVLDMSAMAGYIGGGGLGNFAIAYGYQKFDQTVTWTAVIIMIVLVQVVQGIANAIAKRLLKRQQ